MLILEYLVMFGLPFDPTDSKFLRGAALENFYWTKLGNIPNDSTLYFFLPLNFNTRNVSLVLLATYDPVPSVFSSAVEKRKNYNIQDYNFACGSAWV
jgi:hypothetical protein